MFTRNCYAAIERRTSWAQPLNISFEIRGELAELVGGLCGLMSPKSSAVGLVYFDARGPGFVSSVA